MTQRVEGQGTTPVPTGEPTGQQEPTGQPDVVPKPEQSDVAPAPSEGVPDKVEPVTQPKFDSKAADGIKPLLESAGLVPAEVAKAVTEAGAVTLEIYKALVDQHGEGVASLLKDKLEGLHQANVAEATKRDEAVFAQLESEFQGITEQSGKETWAELSTWAKDNIPNDERKELNALLGKGGISAKLAVQEIAGRFKQSEQFGQAADLLQGSEQVKDNSSSLIDAKTYKIELDKLLDAGHNYNTSPEIKALDRRREKSRQRGI